jgi:YjbE family integral membrane protein
MLDAIAFDLAHFAAPAMLAALGQIILIDVVLAADNAIIVGALASGFPAAQRHRIILLGIGAALVLRIVFALIVTQLLQLTGLVLAGGLLLLLWVGWKFWRELRAGGEDHADPATSPVAVRSFASAAWAITLADVGMSMDNVLAVAGVARDHPGLLVVGLVLSVALMGLAANVLARLIERYRWIAYIGVAAILFVALRMIHDGITDPVRGILTLLH